MIRENIERPHSRWFSVRLGCFLKPCPSLCTSVFCVGIGQLLFFHSLDIINWFLSSIFFFVAESLMFVLRDIRLAFCLINTPTWLSRYPSFRNLDQSHITSPYTTNSTAILILNSSNSIVIKSVVNLYYVKCITQDVVVTILFHFTGLFVVDIHHLVNSKIKTWDTVCNGLICLRGFSLQIFSLQNPLLLRTWNKGCCSDINVDLKRFINVNVIKFY